MSASSDPSHDVGTQEKPVTALGEDARVAHLKVHLREAVSEPTDLIKQGTAPPPYFFAIKPLGRSKEQQDKFAALLGAAALSRMLASMNLVQSTPGHDGGENKSDGPGETHHLSLENPHEYVAAFNEKTEATIKAMTAGPLGSMYRQLDSGATSSLALELTHAELHAKILPRIFGGLEEVGKVQMAELDKVLTSFTAALKSFKVQTSSASDEAGGDSQPLPELNLAVIVHHVRSIDITGGGGIYEHQPFTRLVTFSVKPEHWVAALHKTAKASQSGHAAVQGAGPAHGSADAAPDAAPGTGTVISKLGGWFGGKPKPVDRIKFTLNSTVLEFELNDAMYRANTPKFEGLLKSLANGDEVLEPVVEKGGLDAFGRETCTIYEAVKV